MTPHRKLIAAVWAGLVFASPAAAHDTWFRPLPGSQTLIALGTGNRYPVQEVGVDAEFVQSSGCRADAAPAAQPLTPLRKLPNALLLQTPPLGGAVARSCWAQLQPTEVEIPPGIVRGYLDEIAAAPALRETWARMLERGVVWKERYVKHARIEWRAPGAGAAPTAPVPMGMDLLLDSGGAPIRPGVPLAFQVLRDGRPLADQPLELVDAQGRSGGWLRSDADGRLRAPAPAPGLWALRGTDLRLSTDERDAWDSRFVTLVFEVLAP